MKEVLERIKGKIEYLEGMQEKVLKSMENAPHGILRISKCRNIVQYYLRENENDKNGKYLNKENKTLAYQLAQKEYDEQVLKVLEKQKTKMQSFVKQMAKYDVADIYVKLPKERRKLVQPYVLSDEQYVKQWEAVRYQGKTFDTAAPEIYTERGERVRSKSEKILADKFYMMGIPYRYEYPLHLQGYGIVHPDFIVLNKRTRKEYYWEHFGRMDDVDYCNKTIKKMGSYQRNRIFPGKDLLLTYETGAYPLNIKSVDDLIMEYLL